MKFEMDMIFSLLTELLFRGIKCLLIVVICAIAIKISRSCVQTLLGARMAKSKHMDSQKASTLCSVISSAASYTIIFLAICSILINLGVPASTLTAVLGTGTVAIGLGAQSVIKDIISGFFILLESQFAVGDYVCINSVTGTVEEISIRTTSIRDAAGGLHIIPNGNISDVTNMCKDFANAIVNVDIDYNEDMDHVLDVLNNEMDNAASNIDGLRGRPSVLGIVSLGESGVTVRVAAECQINQNFRVERELRLLIKKRLDSENISIPFPQLTVHTAKREV